MTHEISSHGDEPAPASHKVVLEALVSWINDQTDADNKQKQQVLDFLERNPGLGGDPRITGRMTEIKGRGDTMNDLRAFVMSLSAELNGELDDVEALLSGEDSAGENNIDKT